jgi:hypothetical protein
MVVIGAGVGDRGGYLAPAAAHRRPTLGYGPDLRADEVSGVEPAQQAAHNICTDKSRTSAGHMVGTSCCTGGRW